MSSSPSQRGTNSPKEKRSFTFFRSRTLSGSSNESNSGGAGGGGGQVIPASTSPRLSPRSLFERVRKRSQSDAKSPSSVDTVSATNTSNGSAHNVNTVTSSTSMQIPVSPNSSLNVPTQQQAKKSSNGPPIIGSIIRKHLSHSISEEKDETSPIKTPSYKSFHSDITNLPMSSSIKVNFF